MSSQSAWNAIHELNYGDVHIKRCERTGLVAIVAIHSTALGPALGGCRFVTYPSFEAGLNDALHLAQAMSLKAAISGLNHGGGKSVIIKPKHIDDRQALFTSFGEFINELGGRYITAEDSGVTQEDIDTIKQVTDHVAGYTNKQFKQYAPSPLTALGVLRGIQAAVKHKLGRTDLDGLHVAVKGVGKVGFELSCMLHELGAKITCSDVHESSIQALQDKIDCQVCDSEEIHSLPVDVYAPCALSFDINPRTVNMIEAPVVAGSANIQLSDPSMSSRLKQRGILYAPDFVINAGGLIQVSAQHENSCELDAKANVERIYETLSEIFSRSETQERDCDAVAIDMALERIKEVEEQVV